MFEIPKPASRACDRFGNSASAATLAGWPSDAHEALEAVSSHIRSKLAFLGKKKTVDFMLSSSKSWAALMRAPSYQHINRTGFSGITRNAESGLRADRKSVV